MKNGKKRNEWIKLGDKLNENNKRFCLNCESYLFL